MTLIFKWKFASPHEAPNLIILIQQPTLDQIQWKIKNKNNTRAVFPKYFFSGLRLNLPQSSKVSFTSLGRGKKKKTKQTPQKTQKKPTNTLSANSDYMVVFPYLLHIIFSHLRVKDQLCTLVMNIF